MGEGGREVRGGEGRGGEREGDGERWRSHTACEEERSKKREEMKY